MGLFISIAVVAAIVADDVYVSFTTSRITCAIAGWESRGSTASPLSTGAGPPHPAAAHLKEGSPGRG